MRTRRIETERRERQGHFHLPAVIGYLGFRFPDAIPPGIVVRVVSGNSVMPRTVGVDEKGVAVMKRLLNNVSNNIKLNGYKIYLFSARSNEIELSKFTLK